MDILLTLFRSQRIPAAPEITPAEQPEQQQIMGNHAAPGRNQAIAQQLGAHIGSHNPDTPHADNIVDKGSSGFAHALHHTLDDDGYTIEGLRHRHHPQHLGAQRDYLRTF